MAAMTLEMIRRVTPSGLHHAGAALSKGAGELRVHHTHYVQTTEYPVSGGHAWTGEGQPSAEGVTTATAAAMDGVHLRLDPAGIVLNGLANYLTSAKRKVDDIDRSAANLHVSISDTGTLTIHPIDGESDGHRKYRAAAATVLRAEAAAILVITAGMDTNAATTLGRLGSGDLTTAPDKYAVDPEFWKQSFERPTFWEDMIGAVKGLAIAPSDKGLVAFGLWGLDRGLSFGTKLADWTAKLQLAHIVPRDENGRIQPSKNASWLKKVRWAMDDKNWSAQRGNAGAWRSWKQGFGTWSKWAGRGGTAISFAGSAWDQWTHDSGRTDLSTGDKVQRAAYRGTVVGASSWAGGWAGAEAGAAAGGAIGTAVEPGGGTAVGAVLGGVGGFVGGVAGGYGGNWLVDQTIDNPRQYNPHYYDSDHPGNVGGMY